MFLNFQNTDFEFRLFDKVIYDVIMYVLSLHKANISKLLSFWGNQCICL